MANIYEKMQNARAQLKSTQMKPSGFNNYSKYTYFELADFQPKLIDICLNLKLCTKICFTENLATLTIINSENPEEKIDFTSPMSHASLKGCHEVQNLGAVQTYIKRYLYTNAFDITEHDALDSTMNPKNPNVEKYITYSKASELMGTYDKENIKKVMADWGLKKMSELKENQLKEFEESIKKTKENI